MIDVKCKLWLGYVQFILQDYVYPKFIQTLNYQIMMSYFKDTADAVAEYCTAISCPNVP